MVGVAEAISQSTLTIHFDQGSTSNDVVFIEALDVSADLLFKEWVLGE